MSGPTYRVYRYRGDKGLFDLQSLTSSKMWMARIDTLNDPFEFRGVRAPGPNMPMQHQFEEAGLACFCRGITNPLLWSHYANSHFGFAIGYDPTHPFFGGDQGLRLRFLHDVRYEDVAPSADFYTPDELAMVAVLTKPTCWAYEQEVRMITPQGNQLVDVPPDAVKEVVFGARMPEKRLDEIASAVKQVGLKLRFARMRFLSEGYGVKPVWIE
jgi:Protein of unknown function (DUF2971)